MTLGNMIRDTRIRMNLSQAGLGERVGLSKSCICQYEKGQKLPRYRNMLQIAAALNLDFQVLIQECIEINKDIGWGNLKGEKNELTYLPKYRNDHRNGLLLREELIPFINHSFVKGKYFWFVPDSIEEKAHSEYMVLVMQSNDIVELGTQVVFHYMNCKLLMCGDIFDKNTIIIGSKSKICTEEVNIIGKVVQVLLNL